DAPPAPPVLPLSLHDALPIFGVKLLGELAVGLVDLVGGGVRVDPEHLIRGLRRHQRVCRGSLPRCRVVAVAVAASMRTGMLISRSEEHTSVLQSLRHLVCSLL